MSHGEMLDAVHMAIILHYTTLPQLKGKGALKDQEQRTRALHIFAGRLTDQLRLSKVLFVKGPPVGGHSTPSGG